MLDYVVAGLLFLFGVISAVRSLGEPPAEERGGTRLLIAIHDASRAIFWFSLGGFFLAFGLTDRAPEVRWVVLVPILMAIVRVLTAIRLARPENFS
jgi:hypothetical protein